MRILAGDYKSRKIDTINSPNTRPMMSKVRESIFSSLQFSIPNSDVLDLYAGSGSLGIEALSRGAQFSTFVERSKECIKILEKNLETISKENLENLLEQQKISQKHVNTRPGAMALNQSKIQMFNQYNEIYLKKIDEKFTTF